MATFIALVRALNVGGRSLAMTELRAAFDAAGCGAPRTALQSGNVVFEASAADEAALEAAVKDRAGFAADVVVRTAAEWTALVEANPFPGMAEDDPAHLLVMPLKHAPGAAGVIALQAWSGRERAVVRGREAYLVYPDGIGRSKLTLALVEKWLGVRGTARNWNTVLKLKAMAEDEG